MSSSSFDVDAGLLAVTKLGPVPALSECGAARDAQIAELVTDGVQQLMASLFALPVEKSDDGRVVVLPAGLMSLPREKPLPKKRELTTWEKFAARKGIRSRKRERLQYDEGNDDWRPRYGRNRANDAEAQWCVEHKDGVTTGADPWADLKAAKKARVDKNKAQQERNLVGAKGARLPGTVDLAAASQSKVKGVAKAEKGHVDVAYRIAAASTASMGVFDKRANSLEPVKDKAAKTAAVRAAKPRQLRADMKAEKSANMALLNRILGGEKSAPKIDKDKAANLHKARSERKVHRAKK